MFVSYQPQRWIYCNCILFINISIESLHTLDTCTGFNNLINTCTRTGCIGQSRSWQKYKVFKAFPISSVTQVHIFFFHNNSLSCDLWSSNSKKLIGKNNFFTGQYKIQVPLQLTEYYLYFYISKITRHCKDNLWNSLIICPFLIFLNCNISITTFRFSSILKLKIIDWEASLTS